MLDKRYFKYGEQEFSIKVQQKRRVSKSSKMEVNSMLSNFKTQYFQGY